jgi:hypothetical protein
MKTVPFSDGLIYGGSESLMMTAFTALFTPCRVGILRK